MEENPKKYYKKIEVKEMKRYVIQTKFTESENNGEVIVRENDVPYKCPNCHYYKIIETSNGSMDFFCENCKAEYIIETT